MEETYLTPSWSSQTHSKDGQQPCMCFAEVRKYHQHCSPHADEESDDQQQNLPLRYWGTPQEAPVTTVRLNTDRSAAYKL
jgi:hypothetical protein